MNIEPVEGMSATAEVLARWLGERAGGAPPVVEFRDRSHTAGFSGATVLFDASWDDDAQPSGSYVLKMAPVGDPHPLFPVYDLGRQVAAMRLVAERTGAPVPSVPWWEPDPDVLEGPFLVMQRVDGAVASDVPPYTFGGWIMDLAPARQLEVEESFIGALAALHMLPGDADLSALELDARGITPLERHFEHQRTYYEWIRGDDRFALVEGVFEWLEARWPAREGPAGLVWGDARLANAMFRDGRVVALLDWEAAAVGPPEIDLAWALYFRDYFQRVAERNGHRGLPDFMEPDRVVDAYEGLTNRPAVDLEWHLVYAALRQALTSIRVSERSVLRGSVAPADRHDLILDRAYLEAVLDGSRPIDPHS